MIDAILPESGRCEKREESLARKLFAKKHVSRVDGGSSSLREVSLVIQVLKCERRRKGEGRAMFPSRDGSAGIWYKQQSLVSTDTKPQKREPRRRKVNGGASES